MKNKIQAGQKKVPDIRGLFCAGSKKFFAFCLFRGSEF